MTRPQRELRVLEILGKALELSGAEREDFLDETCGDERGLRREVEDLLAEHDIATEDFLSTTPFGDPLDKKPDIRDRLPIDPTPLHLSVTPVGSTPSPEPRRKSETESSGRKTRDEPSLREAPGAAPGTDAPPVTRRHGRRLAATLAGIALLTVLWAASRMYRAQPRTEANVVADAAPPTLETAASLHAESERHLQQGDSEAAEPLARQALAIRRKLLGEDSVEVADSCVAMSRLLVATGRLEEAETHLERALTNYRRHLGTEHLEVVSTLELYGSLLIDRQQPQRAQFVLREALELTRRLLGDGHPRVAEVERALERARAPTED